MFKLTRYLQDLKFCKVTVSTRLDPIPTWFIWHIKGTRKLYLHRTVDPVGYLKKYRAWLSKGTFHNLPRPVGREIEPSRSIALYSMQQGLDDVGVKHTLTTQGYRLLGQRSHVKATTTSVIAVRLASDPGWYRIIKHTLPKTREYAISEFIDRCTYMGLEPHNRPQHEWIKRNRIHLTRSNLTVTDIANEVHPVEAMYQLAVYIKSTNDMYLNMYMPTF